MASGSDSPSSQKGRTDPDSTSKPIVVPLPGDKVQVTYLSSRKKGGYLKAFQRWDDSEEIKARGDYYEDSTCFIWNNHMSETGTYYLTFGPPKEPKVVCFEEKDGLILKEASTEKDNLPEGTFLFKVEQPRPGIFSLCDTSEKRLVVVRGSGKVDIVKKTDMGARLSTAKNLPHPSSLCEIYIKECGSK